MEHSSLSLLELNSLVRKSIRTCLPDTYWVQAELSDVRANYSGHCYLEFVQKDAKGNMLVAKARGIIWSNVYYPLKAYFERETGQAFVSGIKVLVKVSVDFHELYGYSLTVLDIDPTYTLGDMALRRKEILKRLDEEGVLTLNKELELPELTQRIAVISSATAAGYGDFCNQLEHNPLVLSFILVCSRLLCKVTVWKVPLSVRWKNQCGARTLGCCSNHPGGWCYVRFVGLRYLRACYQLCSVSLAYHYRYRA